MADEPKTCANCGHTQASGAFCEVCGTKLPVVSTTSATESVPPSAAMTPPPPRATPPAQEPQTAPPGAATESVSSTPPPPPPPPPPVVGQPPYEGQPASQPQYGSAPPSSTSYEITGKGFWSKFFDLSFSEYVTPSLIRVLFIVIMVVIGLSVIGVIVRGFTVSAGAGVYALIGGLIYGFLSLLFARVILELIMVFFNIHENTKDIAKNSKR